MNNFFNVGYVQVDPTYSDKVVDGLRSQGFEVAVRLDSLATCTELDILLDKTLFLSGGEN